MTHRVRANVTATTTTTSSSCTTDGDPHMLRSVAVMGTIVNKHASVIVMYHRLMEAF